MCGLILVRLMLTRYLLVAEADQITICLRKPTAQVNFIYRIIRPEKSSDSYFSILRSEKLCSKLKHVFITEVVYLDTALILLK